MLRGLSTWAMSTNTSTWEQTVEESDLILDVTNVAAEVKAAAMQVEQFISLRTIQTD